MPPVVRLAAGVARKKVASAMSSGVTLTLRVLR